MDPSFPVLSCSTWNGFERATPTSLSLRLGPPAVSGEHTPLPSASQEPGSREGTRWDAHPARTLPGPALPEQEASRLSPWGSQPGSSCAPHPTRRGEQAGGLHRVPTSPPVVASKGHIHPRGHPLLPKHCGGTQPYNLGEPHTRGGHGLGKRENPHNLRKE